MKVEKYNNDNPYLEDAVPCPSCGRIPSEIIAKSPPFFICGIPVGSDYGTVLRCRTCDKQTSVCHQPWEAYLEWNNKYGEQTNEQR